MYYYVGNYSGTTPLDIELYTPEIAYTDLFERVVIGSLDNPTTYLLRNEDDYLFASTEADAQAINSVTFEGSGIYGLSGNMMPHFPIASKIPLDGFGNSLKSIKIRGKRIFKASISNIPTIDFFPQKEKNCIASVSIDFVYNGVGYDGIQIMYEIGGVFRAIKFINADGGAEFRNLTDIIGKEIDFGTSFQDLPEFMYNWIIDGSKEIPREITKFDIYLYQNRAEVNRIGKAPDWLDDVGALHGVLRDECSLTAPTIIFEAQQVPAFNYVHIPIFGRYYFVMGIDSVSKNLWRMRLNCDVLETYKNQIWALTAVIDRQENDFNDNLNDPNVPAEVNDYVEIYELENTAGAGFDVHESSETGDMHFIVTTVGGGT